MRKVTVSKTELREALIHNKQDHEADFAITWEKYKAALLKKWSEMRREIDALEPGEPIELAIYLPYPENHAEDYQRAIEMLEWELGDHVVLEEYEFKQYVQDDWSWKAGVTQANMLYAGSASPSKRV